MGRHASWFVEHENRLIFVDDSYVDFRRWRRCRSQPMYRSGKSHPISGYHALAFFSATTIN